MADKKTPTHNLAHNLDKTHEANEAGKKTPTEASPSPAKSAKKSPAKTAKKSGTKSAVNPATKSSTKSPKKSAAKSRAKKPTKPEVVKTKAIVIRKSDRDQTQAKASPVAKTEVTPSTKRKPHPLWLRLLLFPWHAIGYLLYGIWAIVGYIALAILAIIWLVLRYIMRYVLRGLWYILGRALGRVLHLSWQLIGNIGVQVLYFFWRLIGDALYWAGPLVLVLVVGGFFGWKYGVVDRDSQVAEGAVLYIESGYGQRNVSQRLNALGLTHPYLFYRLEALRRGSNYDHKIGEYALPDQASLGEVMDIISTGISRQFSITIAEGLTSAEIVSLIMADDRWVGEIGTIPPEGSLLPQTYKFPRNTDRNQIVNRMQTARNEAFKKLWEGRDDGLPYDNFKEAVVLASMIEKETAIDRERGLVASVFINRLSIGMPLESDPTVLYGLIQEGHPANISLGGRTRHNSPWNTYVIDGLPPTPIANPSLASFAAAVSPEYSSYFFFVADGNGGHDFSVTYDEHRTKVEALRNKNDQ
ncbi:MAG: endolytic transglycosylase MltG [Proteobacteria bacterium]|nr:endolytic transglycosylase MltG [Pseudomonadota bacterium]